MWPDVTDGVTTRSKQLLASVAAGTTNKLTFYAAVTVAPFKLTARE